MRKIIIFINIIAALLFIYSCAKKEPAQTPASHVLTDKISRRYGDLNIKVGNEQAKDLFGVKNDIDWTKVENLSVRQSEQGEVGIFKLYSQANAGYIKQMAGERILNLQEHADNLYELRLINDGEARSYGNYVYYVIHTEKDGIFKIIEDSLR